MKLATISDVSAELMFPVASGSLRVSDPCYEPGTWCAGSIPVLNGSWFAHAGYTIDAFDVRRMDECVTVYQNCVDYFEGRLKKLPKGSDYNAARRVDKLHKERYAGLSATEQELHRLSPAITFQIDLKRWKKEREAYTGRVVYIAIRHESVLVDRNDILIANHFMPVGFQVGVDSGQAGFFDQAKYDVRHEADYDKVCRITSAAGNFGVHGYGAVSSSGWGDGGYTCFVRKNNAGEIVAAFIAFLYEDEGEDDGE